MIIVLEVPCFAKGKQPHDGAGLVSGDPLLWLGIHLEPDRLRYRKLGPHLTI